MAGASRAQSLQSFAGVSLSAVSPTALTGAAVPHPAPSAPSASVARRLQIVSFGDSLTQQAAFPDGWFTLLSARYQRRADLFNRGYSGYTTRNARTTLTQHMRAGMWPYAQPQQQRRQPSQQQPGAVTLAIERLVLVWLGSNDSCTHFTSMPNMHVPLAAFKANMHHIIATLLDTPAASPTPSPTPEAATRTTALLLITPLDQPHWIAYRHRKYRSALSLPDPLPPMLYVEAVKALAAEWGVGLCDVSSSGVLNASANEEWSVDGVHLNAEGNQRVFEAVVAAVEECWPALAVDRLPMDGEDVAEC